MSCEGNLSLSHQSLMSSPGDIQLSMAGKANREVIMGRVCFLALGGSPSDPEVELWHTGKVEPLHTGKEEEPC